MTNFPGDKHGKKKWYALMGVRELRAEIKVIEFLLAPMPEELKQEL